MEIFQEAFFWGVCVAIGLRSSVGLRAAAIPECLVSGVAVIIYVLCLWFPAILQADGVLRSKIEIAGLLGRPTRGEVSELAFWWGIELMVIFFAELTAVAALRQWMTRRSMMAVNSQRNWMLLDRYVAMVLIVTGAVFLAIFPAATAENRADAGQGFSVLARSCGTVGLAVLAFHGAFGSNPFRLLLLAGLAVLAASSVRSPLLVVAIAYVGGLIARGELSPRKLVSLGIVGIVLAILAAVMSMVRGVAIRGEVLSVGDIVSAVFERPFLSVYEAGLDTLDGYRLAMAIQPQEEARPWSILTMVTTFVPRALWPDKPSELTVELSQKYLNYGAGGQFFSPVGYLHIAFGGYAMALVSLFIISLAFSCCSQIGRTRFFLALILLIIFRFMMGGSPFDIYYGLMHMVPYVVAALIVTRWIGRNAAVGTV